MSCSRCPHHVRHGQLAKDGKTLLFNDLCGLRLRQLSDTGDVQKKRGRGRTKPVTDRKIVPKKYPVKSTECTEFPFVHEFDYFACPIYQKTFASSGLKNSVVPTRDPQYVEQISNVSVADLEYL
jgi:hypothetical protein